MADPNRQRTPILHIYDTDTIVSEKVCEYIAEQSRQAIAQNGVFTIGLSGKYA